MRFHAARASAAPLTRDMRVRLRLQELAKQLAAPACRPSPQHGGVCRFREALDKAPPLGGGAGNRGWRGGLLPLLLPLASRSSHPAAAGSSKLRAATSPRVSSPLSGCRRLDFSAPAAAAAAPPTARAPPLAMSGGIKLALPIFTAPAAASPPLAARRGVKYVIEEEEDSEDEDGEGEGGGAPAPGGAPARAPPLAMSGGIKLALPIFSLPLPACVS